MFSSNTLTTKKPTKLVKLYTLLQQVKSGKKKVSFLRFQQLLKQFRRTATRMLTAASPAAKACAVLALAALLSTDANAQCNTFYNADAVNPITVKGLPLSREPFFVDIDNDGDLDCYVLDYIYNYEAPFFYKNIGTAALPVYQYQPAAGGFANTTVDFAGTGVQFADLDGDGDYDCYIAEAYSGNFDVYSKYFENIGTNTQPNFVESSNNPIGFVTGFYNIGFTFADIDSDGDMDLVYWSDYRSYTMQNTGTKTAPHFEYNGTGTFQAGDRAYYDWNKDGLLDYFYDGDYYKNVGPKSKPKYVISNAEGPTFNNGEPIIFTDINNDGSPEVFNRDRGFATLAPVPVITSTLANSGGTTYQLLTVNPQTPGYVYHWYRNGVSLGDPYRPNHPARKSGLYSCTVENNCGTGVSLPFKVNYSAAATDGAEESSRLSITTLNNDAVKVTAYPNPFKSVITIQTPAAMASALAQVTDMQGKVLLSKKISNNRLVIGNELAAGVYLLKITNGNAVVYTQKIVKD